MFPLMCRTNTGAICGWLLLAGPKASTHLYWAGTLPYRAKARRRPVEGQRYVHVLP